MQVLFYYHEESHTFRYKIERAVPGIKIALFLLQMILNDRSGNCQFFLNYKTNCKASESQIHNYGFISNDIYTCIPYEI